MNILFKSARAVLLRKKTLFPGSQVIAGQKTADKEKRRTKVKALSRRGLEDRLHVWVGRMKLFE